METVERREGWSPDTEENLVIGRLSDNRGYPTELKEIKSLYSEEEIKIIMYNLYHQLLQGEKWLSVNFMPIIV